MELEMVLNELSLKTPASDISTARKLMSEFIVTLIKAKGSGIKRVFRTSSKMHNLELALNYPIARWLNDSEVDRDEKRFFKNLATKYPLWTDIIEDFKEEFDLSEIRYQGEVVNGIGFALIIDALSISFNSESRWDCPYLTLEVRRLDDDGEIIGETVTIPHASSRNHIQEHSNWIRDRLRVEVENGDKLWNRRAELFPNLEFCDSTKKQIQSLDNGKPMLRQVLKRLFELQEYCKTWKSGAFDYNALPSKVSPESDSRLKQLKDKLTFECPDGKKRIFSLHARMTPGAWRLHLCDLEPGKVVIGYIGHKIE